MGTRVLQLLVVDDDDVGREAVRRYSATSKLNANIIEARSVAEGTSLLLAGGIDCAILDYHLGDGTAFDMLTDVRENSSQPLVPLILLTGVGNEELAVTALKLGISDYISKDALGSSSLEHAVRTAIAEAKLAVADSEHTQALEHQSLHDELTGLPNRRLFIDRLEQRINMSERSGEPFAVLMLDLDMFKSINDTLGHEAGDHVLKSIGQRLSSMARRSDTYARLGGDEFAIILSSSINGAVVVAQKIGELVAQPIHYGERVLKVDASIGIATYPQHAREAKTLLSSADSAMYESKRGTRRISVFCGSNDSPVHENANISMEIQNLAQEDQLSLHYQPKYHLASGKIVGVEALARWNHPTLGLVPPDKFIPIIEHSKFIFDFTDLVFHKALAQLAAWRSIGNNLTMAINVSAQSLDRVGFVARLAELLQEYGLSPEDVAIEITETASLSSYDRSAQVLRALADSGIEISIDDFGTGYTSIRYLRDFPVAELKIDRLFISEVAKGARDFSIVSGIVRLAKGIGARTVAEGIETVETVRALNEIGCDVGQGYYLACPDTADRIASKISLDHNDGAAEQLAVTA